MNSKKIVPNDLVPIGKILKAHGLLGEVKAFLYNVDSDSLKPAIDIWLNINGIPNLQGYTQGIGNNLFLNKLPCSLQLPNISSSSIIDNTSLAT